MAKTRKSIRYTLGDRIFLTVDFIILVLLLIAIAYPLIYCIVQCTSDEDGIVSVSRRVDGSGLQGCV